MIYFIADLEVAMVKIGLSDNVRRRFTKIQSDSPGKLTLLAVVEGDQAREAELHTIFAADHIRGEWFSLSSAISDFAAAHPPEPHEKGRSYRNTWGDSGLSDGALAALVGCDRATINRIRRGKHVPTLATAARIAKAVGVSLESLAELAGVAA